MKTNCANFKNKSPMNLLSKLENCTEKKHFFDRNHENVIKMNSFHRIVTIQITLM